MSVDFRIVDDLSELAKIVQLEIEIWKLDPMDAVPSHILHTLTHNGGVLVAAYADKDIVGLCVGFPARRDGEWFLWSHMTGVHSRFQGKGIGTQLKLMQREWARDHAYPSIRWTFDPLQRGNANFNIHILGATANIYHVNYYGEMTDSINAGLPSDRLEVIWKTTKSQKSKKQSQTDFDENTFLLRSGPNHKPVVVNRFPQACRQLLVEIPSELSKLKQESADLALEWRLAAREALQTTFTHRFAAVDFIQIGGRYAYVLAAPQPWFLYVVQCSDHSLYTGITNNLERRLSQHNKGKGAAYTATRRPVTLLASWQFPDRVSALKAEAAFKKQNRETKLAQITARQSYHQGVFVEIS